MKMKKNFIFAACCMTTSLFVHAADNWKEAGILKGHEKQITSVKFSTDGKYLITTSEDKTIRCWDIENKKCIKSFHYNGHKAKAKFTPDGKYILMSMSTPGIPEIRSHLWDIAHEREIMETESIKFRTKVSPNSRYLLRATHDNKIIIMHTDSGLALRTLDHTEEITSAAFSPDDEYIVSTSGNGAKLWETKTGKCVKVLTGHSHQVINMARFSPDGNYITTASDDGSVLLFDVKTGDPRVILPINRQKPISYAKISPDGKYLVTRKKVTRNIKGEASIFGLNGATFNGPKEELKNSSYFKFNPNGRQVVIISDSYNNLRMYDLATGTFIMKNSEVNKPQFNRNGTMLAVISNTDVELYKNLALNPYGQRLAFTCGQHQRLGGDSPAKVLPQELRRYICSMIEDEIGFSKKDIDARFTKKPSQGCPIQ